jgi:hypothetical protein
LTALAAFARAIPELTIVLNHIGGLVRIGPYAHRDDEVLPAWRRGIAAVAACPNVILKLGGVGQRRFGFDWHTREKPIGSAELVAALSPLMQYCIERARSQGSNPWQTQGTALGVPLPEHFPLAPVA